ncbi:outer membrane beta-barrel protein [Tamlana sp. s12]|uniref:outer membrane beta-barrel protein n=1 Tax=Tamlana sp. s12 TaxID=1630406 RepID=UPI000802079E|nr:outer membrane beta-barrel protein [Tamlana sp. s12]OBQ52206.1 hypothetical protein VQ01_14070 [Tamlana sp. s12]QQY82313.1 outer membrane beta-barrel protein [Tamlana sp. s12]
MKTKLLSILITVLTTYCYSQIAYEPGYFIDNNNEKTDCLIKNMDWKNNPTEIEYKLAEEGESQKATIHSIKEFGVTNMSQYARFTVNIDRSSETLSKISHYKSPSFKEEVLFLKTILVGKANFYEYNDGNLKRFFYNTDHSNTQQLVFKSYIIDNNSVKKNNAFREQLWNDLKCPDFEITDFSKLNYDKKELTRLFTAYNECHNETVKYLEGKQKKIQFNLNIRPRYVNSSLNISTYSELRNVDFDNKSSFGLGIEAEFILPFNKNKWAIIVEPTFQHLKNKKTTDTGYYFGGELTTNADYNSLEIPLGARYYIYLSKDSKIFINAIFILDYAFDSSISYEDDKLDSMEIKPTPNFGIGLGYKYNDKFSIEVRQQTNRDLLNLNPVGSANYKSLSVILGYTLF